MHSQESRNKSSIIKTGNTSGIIFDGIVKHRLHMHTKHMYLFNDIDIVSEAHVLIYCSSNISSRLHRNDFNELFNKTIDVQNNSSTYLNQSPPLWFSWQRRNSMTMGREFQSRCSHTNWDFPHE